MKLFFRVFLLIQLVTLPLRAQYMVQGVVTDSLTKEPLPYEVGDRKFHLVHAMPSDDPDDRIWRRPKPDDPPYFEDRIAVVGHTPTCYMSGDMESPFAVCSIFINTLSIGTSIRCATASMIRTFA